MDKYDDKMVDMLRQRIAELEVAGDALCRALEKTLMEKGAAEDKLARVRAFVEAAWEKGENAIGWDALNLGVSDILSDTSKPRAVVEGIKAIDGETSHRRACIDAWLPGKAEDWKDETYTLVVMPRESEGE